MDRRTFLTRFGVAAGLGGLAGCGGDPRTDSAPNSPSQTETPSPTPESTETRTESPTQTATPTPSPDLRERPVIFTSPAEVRAIAERARAGEEPWKTGYENIVEDAEKALDANPKSVVDNGSPDGVDDPHRYGTDAPYQGKDGVYSDDINRHDYMIALDMKDWIRDAAQGYAFTGEDKYARQAIDLLHHWFLDDETRMYPAANNFGPHTEGLKSQNSIEHYIFLPGMFYGAALVSGHPYWDEKSGSSEEALAGWIEAFQESLKKGSRGGPEGDEIYKWWVTTRATTAALIDDRKSLEEAFDLWRTTALTDFESRGSFEYARKRTRGLYYSASAVNALTYCAEIARHHGVDLYGYTGDDDSSKPVLERAHDFHVQYMIDPTEWPWQELEGYDRNEREYGLSSYELAYSLHGEGKDKYLQALEKFGRPIHDWRILGWVTATHGNKFALNLTNG